MSSQGEKRALLATCVAAAVKGAEVIRSFDAKRDQLEWVQKTHADFVSVVDRSSEQAIVEIVNGRHADARILGEELTPDADALRGLAFVADPLDGTTNYLHGFPWYAVSIAAVVDGEPIAGAILNVPTGELFTGVQGSGARRNGQPIHVSSITEPGRSLIATGFPFKRVEDVEPYLRAMRTIMTQTAGIRRPGAAALDLADVACGRFEAFWEMTLAPWDIAAGILLVQEAGGVVTDLEGGRAKIAHTGLVVGNPSMHAWVLGALSSRTAEGRVGI